MKTQKKRNLSPSRNFRFEKWIYVSLPQIETRVHIFKKHFENTISNTISNAQFTELAKLTEGLCLKDIEIILGAYYIQPIRDIQKATHFKKVKDQESMQESWMPCKSTDFGAVEISWHQIEGQRIKIPPPVSFQEISDAIKEYKPVHGYVDTTRYVEFVNSQDFGQLPIPIRNNRTHTRTNTTNIASVPPPKKSASPSKVKKKVPSLWRKAVENSIRAKKLTI